MKPLSNNPNTPKAKMRVRGNAETGRLFLCGETRDSLKLKLCRDRSGRKASPGLIASGPFSDDLVPILLIETFKFFRQFS